MPPDRIKLAIAPLGASLGTQQIEGEKHLRAHIPRDEARGLAWLPWSSDGLEHGSKLHKVGQDGVVQETGDRACRAAIRRKPKAISSRQWRRR